MLLEDVVRGKILYADDQYVNQQSIKRHCEELDIANQLTLFNNGQEVIEHLEDILVAVQTFEIDQNQPIQPVKLLLLDINMPIMNGFDTLIGVQTLYNKHNARLNNLTTSPLINSEGNSQHTFIVRPLIVFFSQFERAQFVQFFS